MTYYSNAANHERRGMERLVEGGWYVVRSAGSHGVADLVALHSGIRLFVQCKRQLGALSTSEWNELYRVATELDCQPCVCDMSGPQQTIMLWLLTGARQPRQHREHWSYEAAPWDVKDWLWLT